MQSRKGQSKKYNTPSAFRHALDEQIRKRFPDPALTQWGQKMVAFERFLARLFLTQSEKWVLKGGLALQYRLRSAFRTTMDIDLLFRGEEASQLIHQQLVEAAEINLDDYFSFEVQKASAPAMERFPVICFIGGKEFTRFHIDVGFGDPIVETVETLETPSFLDFAGIPPNNFRIYPISQQIAEKVHACTLPYRSGESSRVKDWVDLLVLAQTEQLYAETLQEAIEETFRVRNTHPLPAEFPAPPIKYKKAFLKTLQEVGQDSLSYEQALAILHSFLDPLLQKRAKGKWNATQCVWE